MLKHLTWSDYLHAVIPLIIIYYAIAVTYYYGRDIKAIIAGKKRLFAGLRPEEEAETVQEIPAQPAPQPSTRPSFEQIEEENFIDAEALVDRTREALEDAGKRDYDRNELLQLLGIIFQDYPSLRHTHFRPGVNDLVLGQASKLKDLKLSISELDALWD